MSLGLQGGSNLSKGAWRGSQVTPIRVVGIRSTTMALEWPCAVKLHPQLPARCPRFSAGRPHGARACKLNVLPVLLGSRPLADPRCRKDAPRIRVRSCKPFSTVSRKIAMLIYRRTWRPDRSWELGAATKTGQHCLHHLSAGNFTSNCCQTAKSEPLLLIFDARRMLNAS